MAGRPAAPLRAAPLDPVLDLARLCGVRRQLRRQHRLRPRLSRAPERPLGRGRRARTALNAARFLVADRQGGRAPARDHRRQRRRLHHALRADLPRPVPRRRQPLRRERPRGAGQGHPQVREPLSRPAGRSLAGGGGAVPGALADPPCRPAVLPDHLLPGPRGRGGAAEPGRADGRGAAPQRPAGRLSHVRRASSTAFARPRPSRRCCAPSSPSTAASSASPRRTACPISRSRISRRRLPRIRITRAAECKVWTAGAVRSRQVAGPVRQLSHLK